jgi:NAD(P)H-dependent FMN reductase
MNTDTRSTLIGGPSDRDVTLGAAGAPAALRIVALLGSTRRGSLNAALLRAARAVTPADVIIVPLSIEHLPFYDGDLESDGGTPLVHSFRGAIAAADGLLIVTPEYNHSLPAVIKNAIDWASRPPSDRLLAGRPVLLMGASAGRSGAKYALGHAAEILGFLGARPFARRLGVPLAGERQDPAGELSDPVLRSELADLLAEFGAAIRAERAVPESAIGSQAVA